MVHIDRFGADEKGIKEGMSVFFSKEQAVLLINNFDCIDSDPITVAAAAALVHMRDKFIQQILPETCPAEIFTTYGAHPAAAVSGKYDRFILYKNRLPDKKIRLEKSVFLEFIYCCMAMGFEEKWKKNDPKPSGF